MEDSEKYEINKNVPVIPPRHGGGRPLGKLSRTIRALNVGDSFYFPTKYTGASRKEIYRAGRTVGISVTIRDEAEGLRVWRLA